MSLFSISGQEKVAIFLQKGILNEKLSHAYIFAGDGFDGKEKMAIEFVKALNCLNPKDGESCGHCLNCQKIEHGNFSNLTWIDTEGQSIKIGQIRSLQENFSLKPLETGKSVYIINEADKLTIEASNSLLKFLEEPASNIIAILLTNNLKKLLPTITSRCQIIYFKHLNTEEKIKLLKNDLPSDYNELELRLAVQISKNIKSAKELIENPQFAELNRLVLKLIKELINNKEYALLMIQEKIVANGLILNNLPIFLSLLLTYYRDMLNIRLKVNDYEIDNNLKNYLESLSSLVSIEELLTKIENILQIFNKINANTSPQLVIQSALLSL